MNGTAWASRIAWSFFSHKKLGLFFLWQTEGMYLLIKSLINNEYLS